MRIGAYNQNLLTLFSFSLIDEGKVWANQILNPYKVYQEEPLELGGIVKMDTGFLYDIIDIVFTLQSETITEIPRSSALPNIKSIFKEETYLAIESFHGLVPSPIMTKQGKMYLYHVPFRVEGCIGASRTLNIMPFNMMRA